MTDNETVKGKIIRVDGDFFEIQTTNGQISRWNTKQIKGLKFKAGGL